MTVAFSATLISKENIGPNLKVARYTMQLPDSWLAAGVAWDLSADFDYVHGAIFGCSGAVGDFGTKLDLIGTITSSGKGKGGIAAASVSIVSHNSAGSAAVFAATADAVDLKAVNDLCVIVFGC
jgi:hypothetical protein